MTRKGIESLFLIMLLLFTFLSIPINVKAPNGNDEPIMLTSSQVVFDESHGQVASLWDTGFHGHSHLAKALIDEGFSVSANTASFLDMLPALSKNDVLVLGIANEKHYSTEEINAIRDFVNEGGGILIIGEHDNFAKSSDFQNPLATQFGITFNSDRIYDVENYNDGSFTEVIGKWIIVNSSFFGLDDICFYFCCTMNLSSNAEPILMSSPFSEIETEDNPLESTPGPAIVGAKSFYGEGRVIAVSDSQFLWNGNEVMGLDYGDNKIFVSEIMAWLSNYSTRGTNKLNPEFTVFTANSFALNLSVEGTINISVEISGGSVIPQNMNFASGLTNWKIEVKNDGYLRFVGGDNDCIVRFFKSQGENSSVLFLENHYSRRIDDSWSGLFGLSEALRDNGIAVFSNQMISDYTIYDCIIISNPLERWDPNEVSQLSKVKKVLLLGEDCSSINGHDPYLEWLRGNGYQALDNPMNSIAHAFDVDFTNYIIYDPNNNGGDPFWPKIRLKESEFTFIGYKSAVVVGSDLRTVAEGYDTAWGEELREGVATNEIRKDEYDLKQTCLIIDDNEVMAMGDLDPLSNQHIEKLENQKIVEVISNWIKNEKKEEVTSKVRTPLILVGSVSILAICVATYVIIKRRKKLN